MGTLFDFIGGSSLDFIIKDPGGNDIATLTITGTQMTMVFNDDAELLQITNALASIDTATHFELKDLQTTSTTTKTLTVGNQSIDLTIPALTTDLKVTYTGNGLVSKDGSDVQNGSVFTYEDGDSITFVGTPTWGGTPPETVNSVTLTKVDGSTVSYPVTATGTTVTISKSDLQQGINNLVFNFSANSSAGGTILDDNVMWKWAWENPPTFQVDETAGNDVGIGMSTLIGLYYANGASVDDSIHSEAYNKTANTFYNLIFEDVIPGGANGQIDMDSLQIKAPLPNYDHRDLWWPGYFPLRDDILASTDLLTTGKFTLLTMNTGETYAQFRARIEATDYAYGVYIDPVTQENRLLINFGSPGDPNYDGIKYSDLYKTYLDSDPNLNAFVGDGNVIGGNVTYFRVLFTTDHDGVNYRTDMTNRAGITYSNTYVAEKTWGASAGYQTGPATASIVPATGKVTILKTDAVDTSQVISNASFKAQILTGGNWVDYTSAGVASTGTTDANGLIQSLGVFVPGTYRLVETSAPGVYDPATAVYSTLAGSAAPVTSDGQFTIEAGQTVGIAVSVTNAQSFDVTYHRNFSYPADPSTDTTTYADPNNSYADGTQFTVLSQADTSFTRSNYYFLGWNTKPDGSGDTYGAGSSHTITADVDLYAMWKPKAALVDSPTVSKAFSTASVTRPTTHQQTFSFTCAPAASNPAAVTGLTGTASRTDAGTIATAFGTGIQFPEAGTYSFTIAETAPGTVPTGYTYDSTQHTWVVTIGSSLQVTSQTLDGHAVTDAASDTVTFTNGYTPLPTAAISSPDVVKTLTGTTMPSTETFNFTCTAASTNPADGASGVGTSATVAGAGTTANAFGNSITFSKAGTYTYTIAETAGTTNGVTYDTTTYTWTIVVADVNGQLTVSSNSMSDDDAEFENDYSVSPGSYTVPTVTKTVAGPTAPTAQTFTYTITADGSAPLPATQTVTTTGAGTANFGSISFTAAGTYVYHVKETDGGASGWTYDASTYDISVSVVDNAGTLTANGTVSKGGTPASAITFNNTYAQKPVTVADPPIKKKISGGTPASDQSFLFSMVGKDGAPMPEGATGDTILRSVTGAGSVELGSTTYTATGTYVYEIKETIGTNTNYTYDTTLYTMTIVVTDDGTGQLTYVQTFTKDGTPVTGPLESFDFDNVFASGTDVNVSKSGDKEKAQAGDVITYTLTVVNTGNSSAIGVWVVDTVPTGTSFVSCDEGGVVNADKTRVDWFFPELAPGDTVLLTFVVKVNDDVVGLDTIDNQAAFEVLEDPTKPTDGTPGKPTQNVQTVIEHPVVQPEAKTATTTSPARTGDDLLPLTFGLAALACGGAVLMLAARRREERTDR